MSRPHFGCRASFDGGGLRGGDWTLRPHGYELHGMTDVPGVALSGTIHVAAGTTGTLTITAHLRVHGRLTGKLTLHGLTLNGRVGGTLVHTRLAAL
ncbi:MAG TPA: hypothetical protein VGX26_10800 [Solirubrobacteraceae bacterium]|nr:hypothetical protein [Solirubrobacteraceae bacterium]